MGEPDVGINLHRHLHERIHAAGRPTPPRWAGRRRAAWSDLVEDRWQDLLGRLEAAVDEIEEIELPVERRPTP